MNKFYFLILFFGCTQFSSNSTKYKSPKLWSEPINDYLDIGQKVYPNDFDTRIGALSVYEIK